MSGHGFEVTGDPADLPPGAKIIELDIGHDVEVAGRAIHEEIKREHDAPWEDLPPIMRHHYMELGVAVVHALVADGWHSMQMHRAVKAAEAADPTTGLDLN